MAITINVNGVNVGGGKQQPPQQPPVSQTPPSNAAPQPAQPVQQPTQTAHQQQSPSVSNQQPTQPVPATQPTQVQQSSQQQQTTTNQQTNTAQPAQQQTSAPSQPQTPQQNTTPMPSESTRRMTDSDDKRDSRLANTPAPSERVVYKRPDFQQYATSGTKDTNEVIPASDRMVSDIRSEISRRGIILVPGTANYSTMLGTLQQQQRNNVMGQLENQYNTRISDITTRKDSLIQEINARIEAARKSELSQNSDPTKEDEINERYDKRLAKETNAANKYFQREFDTEETRYQSLIAEAEQRLAEAMQRITASHTAAQPQSDNATQANVDTGQSNQPTVIPYQRPDFQQYAPTTTAPAVTTLPSSDRIVNDIMAEISQRGIQLVPNTPNYDQLLDNLQQQQRDSIVGQEDKQYNSRMADIDQRRDGLMEEIMSRLEASRQSELATTQNPVERKRINDEYDRLADSEEQHASRFFQDEYDTEEKRHASEVEEAEQRLAEAMQRITASISNQQTQGQQPQPTPQHNNNGGGNNGNGNNPPPNPPQPIKYQRPDFSQYAPTGQQAVNNPLPTSDRMVNDIRAEISRRGIILVPGTQNFSTMLNTLQQNQRTNVMGAINNQYDNRVADIDKRDAALYTEIKARLEASRNSELAGTTDPIAIKNINDRYDRLEERERRKAGQFFAGEYTAAEQQRDSQTAEAEQRLTEALQRLTEELSQGNKDSYLNQLRDKYKTAIWRRDNADTEDGVREASREAAKIQERMQRAMSGSVLSPFALRGITTGAGMAMMGLNGTFNYLHQSDDMAWNLGIEQASSVLNGNAFNAIRQRNQREIAMNDAIGSTVGGVVGTGLGLWGGAALGGKIGTVGGGWGAIIGAIVGAIGGALGSTIGKEVTYYGWNRPKLRENAQVQAADLWRQEEQRIMQLNDLAMLTRGNNNGVQWTRNWYINQAQDPLMKGLMSVGSPDGRARFGNEMKPTVDAYDVFNPYNPKLDLYDLGYTSPEFAQKAAQRIKQRGFVDLDSVNNALYADALERVFSMNSGALGQLSAYDRFTRYDSRERKRVKNNANQDFADLAVTLDALGTTGMRNGAWARSDEFAGYMTQLQGSQRSTFLTVDNERAGRQIATGQRIFGDKFGAEAMQGIEAVNRQVQNPGGGFQQTLLYDVIQELFPETRGRIDLIEQAQYDPDKQNRIQTALAKRVESIYGGVDTTAGYLAMQSVYGIQNPNILLPIAKQMTNGGLEAQKLKKADQEELVKPITEGGYTPEVTKHLNIAADNQMAILLNQMENMVAISRDLLRVLKEDTNKTLDEAVKKIGS